MHDVDVNVRYTHNQGFSNSGSSRHRVIGGVVMVCCRCLCCFLADMQMIWMGNSPPPIERFEVKVARFRGPGMASKLLADLKAIKSFFWNKRMLWARRLARFKLVNTRAFARGCQVWF